MAVHKRPSRSPWWAWEWTADEPGVGRVVDGERQLRTALDCDTPLVATDGPRITATTAYTAESRTDDAERLAPRVVLGAPGRVADRRYRPAHRRLTRTAWPTEAPGRVAPMLGT